MESNDMLQAFFDWFADRLAEATAKGLRQGFEQARQPPAIDEDQKKPDRLADDSSAGNGKKKTRVS
jgi:hypothetical protein